VNQVIEHVHTLESVLQAAGISKGVFNDLDVSVPRNVRDLLWRADHHLDPVAGLEEPGDQAASNVTGGARDEDCLGWLVCVGRLVCVGWLAW
jgi:hypothetical protein